LGVYFTVGAASGEWSVFHTHVHTRTHNRHSTHNTHSTPNTHIQQQQHNHTAQAQHKHGTAHTRTIRTPPHTAHTRHIHMHHTHTTHTTPHNNTTTRNTRILSHKLQLKGGTRSNYSRPQGVWIHNLFILTTFPRCGLKFFDAQRFFFWCVELETSKSKLMWAHRARRLSGLAKVWVVKMWNFYCMVRKNSAWFENYVKTLLFMFLHP
jgi:hypothetical protein